MVDDAKSAISSSSNLQDLLRQRCELISQRHIILFPSQDPSTSMEISYLDLYTQAKKNSSIIRSLHGFEGTRPVLLHLEDHWDILLWFWSVILADGIPVISSPFSNVHEHRRKHIAHLSTLLQSPLCITKPHLIHLFDGEHTLQLCAIDSSTGKLVLQHAINGHIPTTVSGGEGHKRTMTGHVCNGVPVPAFLMLTSGSTGNAKAVCITYDQVLAAVKGKASVRQLPKGRPFLNWIGLDHVASLVEIHLQALWLNVDQIHVHTTSIVSTPITFLSLLSQYRVCRSFAPNFFLAMLTTAVRSLKDVPEWDFSDLTVLASGGEANDMRTVVEVSTLLAKYGAPPNVITPGFGMTETCAGAIFNLQCPDTDVRSDLLVAPLGKCMRGIEMRVTNTQSEEGTKLAAVGETGNLEVRGSVISQGYYRNPEATFDAFTRDGWFRTGDQATIDAEGNLRLLGRAKDTININGVNVSIPDVQALLDKALMACVTRVIVFPSRGAHTEQITVAYIPKEWPPRADDAAYINDLAVHTCFECAGSYPCILSVGPKSMKMLPTSSLGKVSPAKMKALFDEGVFAEDIKAHHQAVEASHQEARQLFHDTETTALEVSLMVQFARTLGIDQSETGLDTSFFTLGSTSTDLIRFKRAIDTSLNISVPIVFLIKYPTPRLLATQLSLDRAKKYNGPQGDLHEQGTDDYNYNPLVVLQPNGTKTPLWLIHPGVGEILVFVGLAQHLSDDERPVYALRARGFEPQHTPFTSIEEAVDTYVRAIRRRQPQGPYALAGYSYGTMLAFEVAKKLLPSQMMAIPCLAQNLKRSSGYGLSSWTNRSSLLRTTRQYSRH